MRVPLSWLTAYVDLSGISPDELRWRFDLAGLEVESIKVIGHPGAELPWDPKRIVTAEVVAVHPHPNADRLVLADVNYGGERYETVVTGAPSLYRRKGETDLHLKVAFAWEGAMLYDGHTDEWVKRKLKRTKIRGIPSRAMVCSEKELGLSEERQDIIYLPDETPIGLPLVEVLGDYIFNFDIKGPFGHLQSIYGIAREAAAIFNRPLKREPVEAVTRLGLTTAEQVDFIELEIADPHLCPRYTATLIRHVQIGPSPFWMQQRLIRAGMRPINNIVDITNYVMLELGEPLHAFDYARLRPRPGGEKPAIIVRPATDGEQMTTLDKEVRTFDRQMVLITDGGGPVAVGGVMGGLESEVTDATRDVLLEAAAFNFINIRRTAQLLKLSTEASQRFGKRVDAELALIAAARAAELMAQLAGGEVLPLVADLYPGRAEPTHLPYTPNLAHRILGVEIPPQEQRRILTRLEFTVNEADDGTWQITVPAHRPDVRRPVDVVEEVARIWGYDRFPDTLIDEALPPLRRNLSLEGEERLRDILTGLGLDEVITYSLIAPDDEARLHPDEGATVHFPGDPVDLRNPLSPERSRMRRTLLPGALRTAWANLRFLERVAIFEIGHVYIRTGKPQPEQGETGVAEPRRLTILMTGPRQARWWQPTDRESLDYFDLKGVVEAMLYALSLAERVDWEQATHPTFHPGRCARVSVDGKLLGYMGELHPLVRETFDLPAQPVALLEWDLDILLTAAHQAGATKRIGFISPYAPVYEDIALVVDEEMPAIQVQRAILRAGAPLVTQALLFDVYRGPQVGAGKKSLAFALTYQAPDKALSERQIERLRQRIIKQVTKQLHATLRGA